MGIPERSLKNNNPYHAPEATGRVPTGSRLQNAFKKCVVFRALYMAIIVGTILVAINHGVCIFSGHFGFTCFWQSALTYLVPYSVSTISSVLAMETKRNSNPSNSDVSKI